MVGQVVMDGGIRVPGLGGRDHGPGTQADLELVK